MNKKRPRPPPPCESLHIPETSSTCGICFDEYSAEDDHRICALPCGHVYGLSCLTKWVKSYKSCPMCKVKVQPTKIIKLFAASIAVKDNSDTIKVQRELDELQRKHGELRTAWIRTKVRADMKQSECKVKDQVIEKMKRDSRNMLLEIRRLEQLQSKCNNMMHGQEHCQIQSPLQRPPQAPSPRTTHLLLRARPPTVPSQESFAQPPPPPVQSRTGRDAVHGGWSRQTEHTPQLNGARLVLIQQL